MLCNKLLTLNQDNDLVTADKSKCFEYSLYSLLFLYLLFPSLQRRKTGIQCGFHCYYQSQITVEVDLLLQYSFRVNETVMVLRVNSNLIIQLILIYQLG